MEQCCCPRSIQGHLPIWFYSVTLALMRDSLTDNDPGSAGSPPRLNSPANELDDLGTIPVAPDRPRNAKGEPFWHTTEEIAAAKAAMAPSKRERNVPEKSLIPERRVKFTKEEVVAARKRLEEGERVLRPQFFTE